MSDVGRLLLVRHAESEGNRDQVFTPTPAVPLTQAGRVQARAAAEWIAARHAPDAVVSSPFTRARQTGDILAEVLRVPVVVEDDLRERSYGAFAGRPYGAPREGYDPQAYWTWRPPDGETLVEVAARAGAVLDRIARASAGREIVVVSHGAVMMALWWHVTGAWRTTGVVRNAGVVVVEHRDGSWLGAREADAA
jgi:broad specificity phosphatase PhoE